jgi:hypothetical protein
MTKYNKRLFTAGEWDGKPVTRDTVKNFPLEHPLTPPQSLDDLVDEVTLHSIENGSEIYYYISNSIKKMYDIIKYLKMHKKTNPNPNATLNFYFVIL